MIAGLPAYRARDAARQFGGQPAEDRGAGAGVVPLPEPVLAALEVGPGHLGVGPRQPGRVGARAGGQADAASLRAGPLDDPVQQS